MLDMGSQKLVDHTIYLPCYKKRSDRSTKTMDTFQDRVSKQTTTTSSEPFTIMKCAVGTHNFAHVKIQLCAKGATTNAFFDLEGVYRNNLDVLTQQGALSEKIIGTSNGATVVAQINGLFIDLVVTGTDEVITWRAGVRCLVL